MQHTFLFHKIFFFFALFFYNYSFANTAVSTHGMVVTSHRLATQVGVNILKQGGNAIDAAVAVGYALAVVEPCCGNIGGGGFMLIHLATGKNIFLNFREKAPALAHESFYVANRYTKSQGYRAVATPGTVMGLNTALAHYGQLSLHTVLLPAIKLAQQGFPLSTTDIDTIRSHKNYLQRFSEATAIFLPNGKLYAVGHLLQQPELAHSLQLIAQQGTQAFYQGSIAEHIIRASQQQGGLLQKSDFMHYKIAELSPLICHYKQMTVVTAPLPGGGVTLCEMLKILTAFPRHPNHFHDAHEIQPIIEAMRLSYTDRNHYLGDPNFTYIPVNFLLSDKHINDLQKQIKTSVNATSATFLAPQEAMETTHYTIADKQGNIVLVTYTLNGSFGSGEIAPGTGFFLNNEMDDFSLQKQANDYQLIQGSANRIQPNKQPLSSMTPTLLLQQGKPWLALGTPGGSTITTQILEIILAAVDYHHTLSVAIAAPRYHMQGEPNVIFVETQALQKARHSLQKQGYHFQVGSPFHTKRWGAIAAIEYRPPWWIGISDPRRIQGLAKGLS